MKEAGLVIVLLALVLGFFQIKALVVSDWQYNKQIEYAWSLADKSSTIDAKAKYVEEFVKLIETNQNEFSSHNAIWMQTPDNSLEQNLTALRTLRSRLNEVMTMDVKSFEYNTAIQQITAQEQGEASQMLSVIKGCWIKANYISVWDWVGLIYGVFWVFILIVGVMLFFIGLENF